MDVKPNKAVVRELDELGNGVGDFGRLDALCTPDMVNHALTPTIPTGVEGSRQFLMRARRDLHPARWGAERDVPQRRHLRLPAGRRADRRALGGTRRLGHVAAARRAEPPPH
ncbi:hypothetical protein QQY66_01565 [Streptomyces sp. DG2A-72]|uniref:hypothetical protein n=1 Tax=Streptomyces sp. DG2A-72 TaxID=3051386 RepID=UPI00265BFCCB|nr:hypothetical protein [Streptomyces sp. DG2A-72]MDO0930450.1 hypothetical protein [Streptomyces sp. DG2A-72]